MILKDCKNEGVRLEIENNEYELYDYKRDFLCELILSVNSSYSYFEGGQRQTGYKKIMNFKHLLYGITYKVVIWEHKTEIYKETIEETLVS